MKKMQKVFIVSFSLFLLVFLYFKFLFWEPRNFEKYSVAYYVKLPEEVKSFKLVKPSSNLHYNYYAADGSKRTTIVVNYQSKEKFASFKSQYASMGFDCYTENRCTLEQVDYFVEALFEKGKVDTLVEIVFIYY